MVLKQYSNELENMEAVRWTSDITQQVMPNRKATKLIICAITKAKTVPSF
jgi:hypothetical protein